MLPHIRPGDVEIGLLERNGGLEVEVVQARGLTMKPGSKGPPGELTRRETTVHESNVFLYQTSLASICFQKGQTASMEGQRSMNDQLQPILEQNPLILLFSCCL